MRLRFAPSPTGFLHIGNARTAVLNHLLSKKEDADLILRIEDTDFERSSRESEQSIVDDLTWLGIQWHEGPIQGGTFGPYRQSERFNIYRQYSEKLLESGYAYHCYCTSDELEDIKADAIAQGKNNYYDGRCKKLSEKETKKYTDEGRRPTIRFAVPENRPIEISDSIKGPITFNSSHIGGDFIIVRSDTVPVYNYIVAIDDHLMNITDVLRGEDHLSNTPKQVLIAMALGFSIPTYAHMPLIMGDDKKKLSKRHGITSVALYRAEGYLPEALYNYLATLGWSTESGEEILNKEEIFSQFDLGKIGTSPAIFDFKKLKWMNGNYIRSTDNEKLYILFSPYAKDAGYDFDAYDKASIITLIATLKRYCELLSDIADHLPVYLDEQIDYSSDVRETILSPYGQKALSCAIDLVNGGLSPENYHEHLVGKIKEASGLKGKDLFLSCRAILTGKLHGPDLQEMLHIMGLDTCTRRIEQAKKASRLAS